MNEQWEELKETIIELRDNDGTGTQQEVCGFLANLMNVLEKQIQEPCYDAISRQAVLDGIDTYINKAQSTGTQDDFYSFAELVVKELPSVTPKLKIGHWIECKDRYDIWYKCSECEKEYDKHYIGHIRYCPNCGAKMEEEEE